MPSRPGLLFLLAPLLLLLLFPCLAIAQNTNDNRLPKSVVGIPIPVPPPDEVDIVDAIQRSQNRELLKALAKPPYSHSMPLRLKWHRRISLKDTDYRLCLFTSDSENTSRVLVLLSLDDQVLTWKLFTDEPPFAYGAILYPPLDSPDTYFVTVNTSSRSLGGTLWFSKYLITPTLIQKLGEGPDLSKIP